MVLNHSLVKCIKQKPLVLQWCKSDPKSGTYDTANGTNDPYDQYDPHPSFDNINNFHDGSAITKDGKNNATSNNFESYGSYESYVLDDPNPEKQSFTCSYCDIQVFNDQGEYERHVVQKHPGRPAYPGPADIQRFERERKEKQQKKREEKKKTTSQQEEPKAENEQPEQTKTEAKVKSAVNTSVIAHSNGHVQLKPYEPPTGKRALDIWKRGSWYNDEMGCCRICQEIGERDPHRKQVRERLFNHSYKSYGKGYLVEVIQVDDDNNVDVYHIITGWPDISSMKIVPPEVLARELRARQAYWKTHSAPRNKLESIKKAAAERKKKLSKLTPEQREALHECEAAAILSMLVKQGGDNK